MHVLRQPISYITLLALAHARNRARLALFGAARSVLVLGVHGSHTRTPRALIAQRALDAGGSSPHSTAGATVCFTGEGRA